MSFVYGLQITASGVEWAASFKLSLDKTFTPLYTLSIFIKRDTNFTHFNRDFPDIMKEMLPTVSFPRLLTITALTHAQSTDGWILAPVNASISSVWAQGKQAPGRPGIIHLCASGPASPLTPHP